MGTTAANGRTTRGTAADGRQSLALAAVVVWVAAVACTTDWERTAAACRHWASTVAELFSAADQKVRARTVRASLGFSKTNGVPISFSTSLGFCNNFESTPSVYSRYDYGDFPVSVL